MSVDVNRMTYRNDDTGEVQSGYNVDAGPDKWYPTVWPDAEGRAAYGPTSGRGGSPGRVRAGLGPGPLPRRAGARRRRA